MFAVESKQAEVPDQLVDQIVKGYDALSLEIRLLDKRRHQLENKLSWAKQQYLDALKRFSPQSASQDFSTFLDELDEAGIVEAEASTDWMEAAQRGKDNDRRSRVYEIQRAADARNKISYRRQSSVAADGVHPWNGKSADPAIELEKDFTTYSGTPGTLKCPFVAPKSRTSLVTAPLANGTAAPRTPRGSSISRGSLTGRRSKRSSFHDPIRAEFCGFNPTDPTSGSPSIEGSAPLCPIRFLDQHSPEEVAKYFEKHKHELPRSHEMCVKRYQSNEESIQQLDAKYGNLVTMIQGLGMVHQPMLPEVSDDAIVDGGEDDEQDRVQRWAASINGADAGVDEEEVAADEREGNDREPHFDRPLKDVRVGESPSRPWGIKVPDTFDEMEGGRPRSDHTASPRATPGPGQAPAPAPASEFAGMKTERPAGKCPFSNGTFAGFAGLGMPPGHPGTDALPPGKPEAPHEQPEPEPVPAIGGQQREPTHARPVRPENADQEAKRPPPQLVFHGPVFFGYSAQDTALLLKTARFASEKPD